MRRGATITLPKRTNQPPLLEVKDFSLTFRHYGKGLREVELPSIRKLDLTIHPGEIVAVVGASGSGKSLLANAILGVLPDNAVVKGTINYRGEVLTKKRQIALRGKEISLIPQSVNALDPLMKTGKQVQAVMKTRDKKERQQRMFKNVGLPEDTGNRYPFELSGGMARRVLAATAMLSGASLIIADEPTPGLDPQALAETVSHLKQLAVDGKGIMFITHDIAVATEIADKIAVFYEGETIEIADVDAFSGEGEKLEHPYSRALWHALPQHSFRVPRMSSDDRVSSENTKAKRELKQDKPTSVLHVNDLRFAYPNGPTLFKGMNFTVHPGEVVGLFGYSGSGKSTLAQIMSGYLAPLEGQVLLENKPIAKESIHPVQLIWQHPEKTINPRWRMGKVLEEAGAIDLDLIRLLGIKEEWFERFPSELSGGELQRFCLARAVANEQIQFVIADEITTMLDTITQAQIWEALTNLVRERKIGVLAISHDLALLQRVSDRVIDFTDIR